MPTAHYAWRQVSASGTLPAGDGIGLAACAHGDDRDRLAAAVNALHDLSSDPGWLIRWSVKSGMRSPRELAQATA